MAHHLIYLPISEDHAGEQGKQQLASVGLADHIAGAECRRVDKGPDGKPGLLFGWLTPGFAKFGYAPDQQVWARSAAFEQRPCGAYWVGTWNDHQPREVDLRRPYMQRGVFREMGADRWKIPRTETIEMTAKLQDDGSVRFIPQRELEWFTHDCEKRKLALRRLDNGDGTTTIQWSYSPPDLFIWLSRVLRINYRITPEVMSHLGMLSKHTLTELYMATLGIDGVEHG